MSEQKENEVRIGDLYIPDWQFQIYQNEALKFLSILHKEVSNSRTAPLSAALVRAVHTLSGTTNTLGFDEVARLVQPFEIWLNHLIDSDNSAIATSDSYDLIEKVATAITVMVSSVCAKQRPTFLYQDLIDRLNVMQQAVFVETPSQHDENNIDALLEFTEENNFDELDNLLDKLGSVDSSKSKVSVEEKFYVEPVVATKMSEQNDIANVIQALLPEDDVTDDVDDSIKDIFLEEALDIFDTLPKTIEKWIVSSGQDVEHANLIKRALHTLKGSARMAGYLRFGHLVHNVETVMTEGFPGMHSCDLPEIVQLTCDAMAQEVEHLQDNSVPSGFYQLRHYNGVTSAMTSATTTMLAPVTQPITTPVTSSVELPEEKMKQKQQLDDLLKLDEEQSLDDLLASSLMPSLERPLGFAMRIQKETVAGLDEESVAGILRVPTSKVDTLSNQLSKNGMIQLRVESSVELVEQQIHEMSFNMERLRRLLRDVEIQAETQMKSRINDLQQAGKTFDPLELDRFSRLQELTRMTSEAMNDINNSQAEIVRGLVDIQDSMAETNIVSDDMQHTVMSVRTVPVSSMKRRLDRLVRQSCRDSGKQAEFILENELDIDSGVLNKVIAPMEHLVRNSIAHGIEVPGRRIELGKNENGAVRLNVFMHGNDIIFRLTDDGAGINCDAVQRKAREKGIIGADEEITQERANMLIFNPGFSTADQISTLSGRGVGMDVVQTEISSIGGRINVHSEPGKGSTIELIVPSYMSVISMVPARSGKVTYAIPATLIQDVVVKRERVIEDAYITGVLRHNDIEYPFYGLAEVNGHRNEIQRNNRVLIVSDNEEQVAVHIDALENDRNLVMKPLCRTIASLPGLMGSTVAGDGTPLLVINPVYLRSAIQRVEITTTSEVVEVKTVKTRADITVMVVDDSLTVRRITQKFLDREGFQCIVAKDGLDAIEKITEHGCPDIFLSDIEMPNMDGFQLVEHIRTAVSKTVPIIMISSRSIEKYADHARELGVNKSIGKPYQEPELLEAIEELTGLIETA